MNLIGFNVRTANKRYWEQLEASLEKVKKERGRLLKKYWKGDSQTFLESMSEADREKWLELEKQFDRTTTNLFNRLKIKGN